MAVVISIANQKGGIGKTTTAAALASGLNMRGKKTLVIDLDPQGNLTYSSGASTTGSTALGVLSGEAKAEAAIRHTVSGDIIPANRTLAAAEYMFTEIGKEYKLKEALEPVLNEYKYIVIDTPPALDILATNALTASDYVIIPAQAEIFSVQGIGELEASIENVKHYCNSTLSIAGVLLTRYNARAVLSKEVTVVLEQMAAQLNTIVFNTKIREGIAIREAQVKRESIFTYAPTAKVTEDYNAFVDEVLNLIEG